METTDTLLQKLLRLRDDPAATPAERTAAAEKLRARLTRLTRLTRLGLTEADLFDGPQEVKIPIDSEFDYTVFIQIVGQILSIDTIDSATTQSRSGRLTSVSVSMPNTAAAQDLRAAWLHYGPSMRATRASIATERKSLRQRIKKLDDEFATAFINKFKIFPEASEAPADESPREKMTLEELLRKMRAAQSIPGDPWSPRRQLATAPLQLT